MLLLLRLFCCPFSGRGSRSFRRRRCQTRSSAVPPKRGGGPASSCCPPPPRGRGVGVWQLRPTEPPRLAARISSGLAEGSHEEGRKSEPGAGFWGSQRPSGRGLTGAAPSGLQPGAEVALGQRDAQHDAAAQQEARVLQHEAAPRPPAGTPQHLGELGRSGGSVGRSSAPRPQPRRPLPCQPEPRTGRYRRWR